MNKIEFKNLPETSTPLNADNLNAMQDNIEEEIGTKISKSAIKTINASDDFNNLIETGIYQYGGTNSANRPPNWGTVEVTNANGYIVHKCYGSGSIATRFSTDNGNTWMDWQEWRATSQNITTGTEYLTGRIIDGKKEYAKFINFGNLGNATNKTAAHGLTNVTFTKIVAHVTNGNVSFDTAYGYALSDSNGVSVSCNVQGSYVQVTTNSDRTEYTALVELNYLKN